MNRAQPVASGKNRRDKFRETAAQGVAILPSMLQCRFDDLRRECDRLADAGAKMLHLDAMDGHFVPNFTYGMPIVAAFAQATDLPLDVHLMIADPARYAMQFVEAGASSITFHIEACPDPAPLLQQIQNAGVAAGLAINPSTDLAAAEPFLPQCDLVLVMSVEAGFGGQKFNSQMLHRTEHLRAVLPPQALIEMDGGLNEHTVGDCVSAGAQLLVIGSAIFGSSDYSATIRRLGQIASSAK